MRLSVPPRKTRLKPGTQVGEAGSAYLAGAIIGSLLFGRLTDLLGRKKLFLVTLFVYLLATIGTALSWNFWSFAFFRALTGAGIGGEYSAINSAIDELLPSKVRGRADLAINSTYWVGTALGAASTLVFLNPHWISHTLGWRLSFGLGAILGLSVLLIRSRVPESPRWLLLHGRVDEAEKIIKQIETEIAAEPGIHLLKPPRKSTFEVKGTVTFKSIIFTLFTKHRERAALGLILMVSQAFAYNAIFFTYALILGRFYNVAPHSIGYYIIPFSIGNFLGPFLLGRYFDTLGRKPMIAASYSTAGILLALTGFCFSQGWLTGLTQTVMWCVVFFIASAAASSAYLTVSELFPVEMRGLAIALFYALGTATGGLAAPAVFGALIETGDRQKIFYGYLVGASLMILGAIAEIAWGVSAERKSLEDIALGDDAPA